MSKSIFKSRDINPPKTTPQEKKEKYQGPEARRYIRRVLADRRAEVRFEINTVNRRKNAGRRSDDIAINFY